jgi:hypothetical protein
MEYRKKKMYMMMENLMIVFLTAFTLLLNDWLIRLFLVFFLYLLIKDQIVNRNYHITSSKDGLHEYKGKKERFYAYDQIEFITVNRKYKKYIAIGNTDSFILIRNNIEGRQKLVNHIIKMTESNKDVYVDDRVNDVLRKYE